MKNIVKTLGLLSVIAVIPGAMAATSRVSMVSRASPRLSVAGWVKTVTSGTTGTTSSGTTPLYGDTDCIDAYTECITADDVCGSDFQECTTNVLFHAQMPKCLNILYQCSSDGVDSLFGTSKVTDLSNVDSTREEGGVTEVVRYTYPLDGSILGQRIIGGSIANGLTTEQCVRRYTNCLQRDDICGSDFELCTTPGAFKKQAPLCASTLARCDIAGKTELFGSAANAAKLEPGDKGEDPSRLKSMIADGAQLAAANAVRTCQRVTDNCLVSACVANPWRCVEGTSLEKIEAADFVGIGDDNAQNKNTTTSTITKNADGTFTGGSDIVTGSEIRKMLKAQCLDTIGANKYCHITYREKSPNNKDLLDPDLMEDVFSLAYAARKEAVNTKIQEEIKKFDTAAKDACSKTIMECAMRSCGGGIGSVCYTQAKTDNSDEININGSPYNEIKSGCSAIVNTDPYCVYADFATRDSNSYSYSYNDNNAFGNLFTDKNATNVTNEDPIGVVGKLNALLATSYNEAAIEALEKQCKNTALSCVRSMCGKDYTNCYRNRTDIISGTYETGTSLDKSMNKMGGILDYNIVIGLCMNTITESSACEEHLKIVTKGVADDLNNVWTGSSVGNPTFTWENKRLKLSFPNTTTTYTSVGDAWAGANATRAKQTNVQIVTGCTSDTDLAVTPKCSERGSDSCGTVDEDGCIYEKEEKQSVAEFTLGEAAQSLFQKLLVNVEREVQAKYNAKLTKEQNTCNASNNGGIMGRDDNGSTFKWVKLNSSKIPKNYVTNGLSTKNFKETGDLYGAFCRARITVMSDDKLIQEELAKSGKNIAYFAVGDSFTCGSWIDQKTLTSIGQKVANKALCDAGYGKWNNEKNECNTKDLSTKETLAYAWGTVAPALATGAIGWGLSGSGLLTKWANNANINNGQTSTTQNNKKACAGYAKMATDAVNAAGTTNVAKLTEAKSYLDSAMTMCKKVVPSDQSDLCNTPDVKTPDKENAAEQVAAITAAAKRIETTCEGADDDFAGSNQAARVWTPIVSSVAGGALGMGITASVLSAQRDQVMTEAEQKWMSEVGEHIQCYLGVDELGSYGDVISIEIE